MNRYAKQCVSRSRQAKRGRNQLNIHSPDVEEMLDRSSLMRMTVIDGTIIRLVLMLTNWIYVQSSKTPRPYLHMPSKAREASIQRYYGTEIKLVSACRRGAVSRPAQAQSLVTGKIEVISKLGLES